MYIVYSLRQYSAIFTRKLAKPEYTPDWLIVA